MTFGVQICANYDVEVLKTDRKVRIDVILKKVLVLVPYQKSKEIFHFEANKNYQH